MTSNSAVCIVRDFGFATLQGLRDTSNSALEALLEKPAPHVMKFYIIPLSEQPRAHYGMDGRICFWHPHPPPHIALSKSLCDIPVTCRDRYVANTQACTLFPKFLDRSLQTWHSLPFLGVWHVAHSNLRIPRPIQFNLRRWSTHSDQLQTWFFQLTMPVWVVTWAASGRLPVPLGLVLLSQNSRWRVQRRSWRRKLGFDPFRTLVAVLIVRSAQCSPWLPHTAQEEPLEQKPGRGKSGKRMVLQEVFLPDPAVVCAIRFVAWPNSLSTSQYLWVWWVGMRASRSE